MSATHGQEVEPLSDEQRAITKRLADICRADPAAYAALVRYNDTLQGVGMDRYEAWTKTLAAFDGLTRDL